VAAAIGQQAIVGTQPTYSVVGGGSSNFGYLMDLGLEFSHIESLSKSYKIDRVSTRVLMPGQIAHYYSKIANKRFDFSKKTVDNMNELASYVKGEKQMFFRTRPRLTTVYEIASANFQPQRTIYNNARENGILVEIEEVFKIEQPSNTDDANDGPKRAYITDYAHQYGSDILQKQYYQGETQTVTPTA
jgi:hypothetical protein